MLTAAESSACRPEAQLRITVHAGTLSPQPRRSDTTRAMLASSADGIAAPTITSSNAFGSNGWRLRTGRRAVTPEAEPGKAPRPRFPYTDGRVAPPAT